MTLYVCGPHRQCTGLLEMDMGNKTRLATWDCVKGNIDTYTPDYDKMKDKTITYHKKTYTAKDFSRIQLTITAGDIIQMEGYTWGTDEEGKFKEECVFSGPATGSFALRPHAPEYVKELVAGTNPNFKIVEDE